MGEEIDHNKRKTLQSLLYFTSKLKTLSYLAPALILPSLFLPKNAQALEVFDWKRYSTPDPEKELPKLLERGFPDKYDLNYIIPDNVGPLGIVLGGGFRLKRNDFSTSLEITLNYSEIDILSAKTVTIEEVLKFEKRRYGVKNYFEKKEVTRDGEKETKYDEGYNCEKKTMFDLANRIIKQNTKKTSLIFYGKDKKPTIHSVGLSRRNFGERGHDFEIMADINKRDPKTKKLRVFFDKIPNTEMAVPVELWVDYEVKGIPVTVRSALTIN